MKKWLCTAMAAALVFGAGSFAMAAPKTPKVPKEKKEVKTPEQKFADLDSNSDGKLSLEEFQATAKTDAAKTAAEKTFKRYDADNSGDLSVDEFKNKGNKPKQPKKTGNSK